MDYLLYLIIYFDLYLFNGREYFAEYSSGVVYPYFSILKSKLSFLFVYYIFILSTYLLFYLFIYYCYYLIITIIFLLLLLYIHIYLRMLLR